jgi:polyhydroxyalkanoate synthesis regulator phasin
MATLFGWKFEDPKKEEKEELQTFSTPEADDGASYTATSGVFGTFLPSDSGFHNEFDLIARYRSMVMHPECELAVDEIVNESIVSGRKNSSVSIELDYLEDISEMLKERIRDEFEYLLEKLNFKYNGYEIFRRWFVDGRLYYHVIIDQNNTQKGIVELRTLDPFKIKKIREKKENEQKIQIGQDELIINQQYYEYFLYSDTGIDPGKNASTLHDSGNQKNVLKIAPETIAYVNSGLLDERRTSVISYLHKAFRALNQVRMLEDASIIYRLSRAPSRRVFYVDVGNLPKAKAEQYMYSLMNQYRNKMVYDSKTGTMKDDRKFQTMLEDYWMPRRNGCFDLKTKISLLDGRNVELGQLIVEHNAGKENWTYSVDQKGHVVPGLISWAGVTRNDAEVLDVHLDNGEVITATPDHKFILRNGERIEASNLTEGSSLMPFNTKRKAVSPNNQTKEYLQVQHNDTEKYEFVHRAVSKFMNRPQEKTEVIHHIDLNRFNNTPSNLKIMERNEHIELHDENHQDEDAIIQNHTVVKVVRRTDRMDVGTLTIDGEHQYHDYHNFALSSGIFVMNSATTEIDTIQGSEANFTQLDELEYFQRQLFRSLNVPISRMQPESGFSLGRASEISREEYKFLRFIERLRNRFSMLFIELLKKQLVLKNIMSLKQWEEIKSKIHFVFDQDSNFNSLKNLELLSEKMNVLREAEEYRGKYFSANYIRKEILAQTDEDIERIDDEIEEERYDSKFGMQQGEDGMGGEMGGGFGGGDAFGGLGPEPAGGAPLGATPEEGGMENDLAPEPTDTTINPGV